MRIRGRVRESDKPNRFPGIDKRRSDLGLREDDVGRLVGQDKDFYQRFQRGRIDIPFSQLLAVCAGLQMSLDVALNYPPRQMKALPSDVEKDSTFWRWNRKGPSAKFDVQTFKEVASELDQIIREFRSKQGGKEAEVKTFRVAEKAKAYRPGKKR